MSLLSLRWLRVALCLLGLGGALPASAVCGYTDTGGQLGSVNSFRVRSGPAVVTNANFKLDCGVSLLGALTTSYLQLKIVSPTTGLTLKRVGNTPDNNHSIPYQIAPQLGGSFTQGALILNLSGANLISLLANNTANLAIAITTTPGPNVPQGLYTDTITINWNYANICQGLAVLNACVSLNGPPHTDNVDRQITVQLTVTNDCTVTAPNVVFGSAPLPSAFGTVSQSISMVCTRGTTYSVGLDAGRSPENGRRRMAGNGAHLAYDIYKANGSIWGKATDGERVRTAESNGIAPLLLPYSARVYPDQPAPPPGLYQDTVTVDVQF